MITCNGLNIRSFRKLFKHMLPYVLFISLILTGCAGRNKQEVNINSTSFRHKVGDGVETVYLGKPRTLKGAEISDSQWESSDEKIATVQNGVVTGKSEGLVTVSQIINGETVNEWQLAVTTFNDGRQPEISYELGKEGIREILSGKNGAPKPEFWKQNINTIQDAISYFQLKKFEVYYDLPILATGKSEWYWCISGDHILYENRGGNEDITSAVGYLLADDFEDSGYIFSFGYTLQVMNWFYEDGKYYIFNFRNVLMDFRDGVYDGAYRIFVTDNTDDIMKYVSEQFDMERSLSVIMFSASGHDYQPAYYFSYIHDSSQIYDTHSRIGMEDTILEKATILYSSKDFDYELIGIPISEIPTTLPVYGTRCEYEYE